MTVSTVASYDAFADWYEEWLGDGSTLGDDPFALPLLELVGSVAGQRVCDLACGQGRVSRHLAGLGATVVGVDVSGKMLAIARSYPVPEAITYRRDDAHTLTTFGDDEFDGVLCNMALMDIADLDATLTSAARGPPPRRMVRVLRVPPLLQHTAERKLGRRHRPQPPHHHRLLHWATGNPTAGTAPPARSAPITGPWPPSSTD